MPTLRANGVELHYVERGSGEQTIVFAHSYLSDHRHFEPQLEALAKEYRVIAYDHRDHGQSARATAPYSMDDLVADGVAVIEQTGAGPCHWVGLSTGGFVGLRLLQRHPELLRSMILMDTTVRAEPLAARLKYKGMLAVLALLGTRWLMGSVMGLMFARSSLADPSKAEMLRVWRERMAAGDPAALSRFGRAIWARDDLTGKLTEVEIPTLVVVGQEDRALPPSQARLTAAAIPGARLEVIEGAGHLCTLEQPEAVTEVLRGFLESVRT